MQLAALSELPRLAKTLPRIDAAPANAAIARQAGLTKPVGSLGRLEDVAVFMAGWQGEERPEILHAQALIFAGNHGVCAQGVNAFPQSVTAQMVANFEAGGAAINQLCAVSGTSLSVIAIELDTPTADFTETEALSEPQLLASLNRGMAAVGPRADILVLGEMGIGNSTVAAALCAALFGDRVGDWVGPGTGVDASGIAHKTAVIERGLHRHQGKLNNPVSVLQAFGGHEQAALCGAIIAARAKRIPVLLDGFICSAAAAVLHAIDPTFLDHCLVGHKSQEPGHAKLLAHLNKEPLLDLNMRLGEGTGAALALTIVRGALACHNGMATFAEAGVSPS